MFCPRTKRQKRFATDYYTDHLPTWTCSPANGVVKVGWEGGSPRDLWLSFELSLSLSFRKTFNKLKNNFKGKKKSWDFNKWFHSKCRKTAENAFQESAVVYFVVDVFFCLKNVSFVIAFLDRHLDLQILLSKSTCLGVIIIISDTVKRFEK